MGKQEKFIVIYSFQIVDGKENEFIHCWKLLTELIYKYEGSLGSRLHKIKRNLFIAYAQWPNKDIFEKSGNNLPEIANEIRTQMREFCSEITREYESSEIVCDLLKNQIFDPYS